MVLVLFAVQCVGSQAGREDWITAREPGPGKKKEPAEEQRHADFRHTERRAGPVIDGRHDLEIALQPDAEEADDREAGHRGRKLLRLDAQQSDEWDQEDEQKDGDADRPPGAGKAVENEVRLFRKVTVPNHEKL